MNYFKRAYLQTVRKREKTILLLCILTIISTFLLICFSIQTATTEAHRNVRESLGGSFTINAKQLPNGLSENDIKKILSVKGIKSNYNLRSYMQAEYRSLSNEPLKVKTEGASQVPAGYEHAGKIISELKSETDTYFTEAGFELTAGKHISNEKNVVLVHEEFAKQNNLTIGDAFVLGGLETDNTVTVKIIGIFTNAKKQDSIGVAPSYDLYENIMFTDIDTGSHLLYSDEIQHYQYADFYVLDPENLIQIIKEVKDIPQIEWEKCIITKYDSDYQHAKDSLLALKNIVKYSVVIIMVVSTVLLTLILTLWLKSRIYEIGIFLSMGISKVNIMLQQLTELFILGTIAIGLSLFISLSVTNIVSSNLNQQLTKQQEVLNIDVTKNEQTTSTIYNDTDLSIGVHVSMLDWLTTASISFGIITVSTLLSAYPLMRLMPKKILSKID